MESLFSFAGLLVSVASIILVTRITISNASKTDLDRMREALSKANEQIDELQAKCDACAEREFRLMARILKLEQNSGDS